MSNRVREVLRKRGETQKSLALRSGIDAAQISRICNGASCMVTTAQTLARALDTTVEDLFPAGTEAA